MRIAVAADHTGIELKALLLLWLGERGSGQGEVSACNKTRGGQHAARVGMIRELESAPEGQRPE